MLKNNKPFHKVVSKSIEENLFTIRNPIALKKMEEDKINRLNNVKFEKGLVFVAMSFKVGESDEVFNTIKVACKALKLDALRVDENYSSGFISLEISHLIELAEYSIFDLTYERPNVYYELGYAHGIGNWFNDVLLIAKEGTNLHFNIAGLRVHSYKSIEDLKKIVKANLTRMMKATRLDTDLSAIINAIDEYLILNGKESIGAPDAEKMLEEKGLIKSYDRKGSQLRYLLNDGLLNVKQPGGKGTTWFIYHSKKVLH